MANTYVDYTGDGSETDFNFTFPYIKTSHVVVEVNDGPAGGTNRWVRTSDFTVQTSPTTFVRFNSAPANLVKIRVLRDSDANTGIVDFANGSVLTETELDNAYNHNRYLAEEAEEGVSGGTLSKNEDGQFNADALRIENVADPDSDDDAVNKGYADTRFVNVTGDTMGGPLAMGNNKITNLANPSVNTDAANKTYVDAQIAATLATGVAGGPIDTANIADDAVTADKLAHTAVTPGSYTNTNLTVDQQGRITAASSGSAGSAGTVTSVDSGTGLTGGPITTSGTLSIENGGVDTTQLADNAVTAAKISSTDSTFSIDGSGNMGLGIAANSAAKLYISGTGGNTFLAVKSDTMAAVDLEDSGAALNQKHYQMVSLDGAYEIRQMNDNLSIKETPLTINSSGNVGIGAGANTEDKLLISSNDSALTVATIENTNSSGAPLAVLRLKARGNATMQLWDTNPTPSSVGVFNVESANGEFVITADPAGTPVTVLVGKANGTLNLPNLPTSSAGLASGDVWNNSGVLNIVP